MRDVLPASDERAGLILVVAFAIAGIVAGFAIDRAVARLARAPFDRPADFDDSPADHASAADIDAADGAVADAAEPPAPVAPKPLPRALTTRAWMRTAAIVVVTAALFAASAARYDDHGVAPAVVAAYMALLVGCAATDAISFRVPNAFTYPAILLAVVVGLVAPGTDRVAMLSGGFGLGFGFLALAIISNGGLGMGDVKMAVFSGFALGLMFALFALLVTAMAGGVIALALLLLRIRGRRDPIPYAPFIAIGTAWALLAQGTVFLKL